MMLNMNNQSAFEYNKQKLPDLQKICAPLFTSTPIKFFRYMRIFDNGDYISLGSNIDYMKYYLQNIHNLGSTFHSIVAQANSNNYFYLWKDYDQLPKTDKVFSALLHHNIWHGCSVYKRQNNFVHSWNFATEPRDICLNTFYINNIPLLEHFICYFNIHVKTLINNSNKIVIAKFAEWVPYGDIANQETIFAKEEMEKFLTFTVVKKAILCKNSNIEIHLSTREADCLHYLSLGNSIKEVANNLNLSPRTVESYVNNIKNKTGYYTRSQLVTNFLKK
jgi:DNA-binding CsgD family transcriptional regulator